jgi:hypothetical protein
MQVPGEYTPRIQNFKQCAEAASSIAGKALIHEELA